MVGIPDGGKTLRIHNFLDSTPACDGRTDGQTSCHGIVLAMHTRRAVKREKIDISRWLLATLEGARLIKIIVDRSSELVHSRILGQSFRYCDANCHEEVGHRPAGAAEGSKN